MDNSGLWNQITPENLKNFKITYERGNSIQQWHLIEVQFYCDWLYIKYTNGAIKDWEELETAINHFKLIQQWRII